MNLKKLFFVILAISLAPVSCKVKQQNAESHLSLEPEAVEYATVPDITENDIHWHIGVLASDSMRGRKAGTPYEAQAAQYVKSKFEALGLKPFNNNYFQPFPISTHRYFNNCKLYFADYQGDYPADFRPMIMFDSLTVAGEVVFAGDGNDSDYDKLDVKGKWVMIREVRNSILYDRKATAKSKGAAGLLAIGIDGTSGEERYVLPSDSFPMIKISQNFANHLLAHAGATVTATIQSVKQQVSSQNVVAYMETGDSPNENDFIAIGAHYDHIGTQMSGDSMLINNGADDNASGVAGLLEIAEKIRSAENLKYNVLFVAFGAEELGLIGSHFFCENPPLPLEKIKLMVNLDMIGRMDSVNHVYINTIEPNVPLNTVVDEVKSSHPDIDATLAFDSYLRGSDHTSFYNKHIPVIFFTTGLHSGYHTPADTIGAINYKGEKQALDFIYDFILKEEGH